VNCNPHLRRKQLGKKEGTEGAVGGGGGANWFVSSSGERWLRRRERTEGTVGGKGGAKARFRAWVLVDVLGQVQKGPEVRRPKGNFLDL